MKNLAEELTESWSGFRYEDPYEEVYQKAIKVVEECEHTIKLCKRVKELVSNLERKLKDSESGLWS
jgi:HEPN domain-containing protein